MKRPMKIAFCGMMAALGTAVMFFTGVIPVATIALPALAGCLLIPVVAELGVSWGFGVYAVCGVLSLLVAPDREAALIYLLFFGYYPVLLGVLGRIQKRGLLTAVKFLLFNAAAVAETWLTVYVLGIPYETIAFLGRATPLVMLVLANLMFYLYDRALGGLVAMYFRKFHAKVQKALRGKSI